MDGTNENTLLALARTPSRSLLLCCYGDSDFFQGQEGGKAGRKNGAPLSQRSYYDAIDARTTGRKNHCYQEMLIAVCHCMLLSGRFY